jgi:hypothetical protein
MEIDYRKLPQWEFTIDDGRKIRARFLDQEIEQMKKEHPEIKFYE